MPMPRPMFPIQMLIMIRKPDGPPFPERLEENGISWKIYQNEISLESGLDGDEDGWLANFTDNPIEWFSQYRVRFSPSYRHYLGKDGTTVLPGQK